MGQTAAKTSLRRSVSCSIMSSRVPCSPSRALPLSLVPSNGRFPTQMARSWLVARMSASSLSPNIDGRQGAQQMVGNQLLGALAVAVGDRIDDGAELSVGLLAHQVGRRLVGISSVEQHRAAVVEDRAHDLLEELV